MNIDKHLTKTKTQRTSLLGLDCKHLKCTKILLDRLHRELAMGAGQCLPGGSQSSFSHFHPGKHQNSHSTSADLSHHICKNNRKIPDPEPRRRIDNLVLHYTRAQQPLGAGPWEQRKGSRRPSCPIFRDRACGPQEGGLWQSPNWSRRKESLEGTA